MGANGEPDEPFLTIDDRDFTPREFADGGNVWRLGMRIAFVPDDEVYEEPIVEVREPDSKRTAAATRGPPNLNCRISANADDPHSSRRKRSNHCNGGWAGAAPAWAGAQME